MTMVRIVAASTATYTNDVVVTCVVSRNVCRTTCATIATTTVVHATNR